MWGFVIRKVSAVGLVFLVHLIGVQQGFLGSSGFTGVGAARISIPTVSTAKPGVAVSPANVTQHLAVSGDAATTKAVKVQLLQIPDRTPANFTIAQVKEESSSGDEIGSGPTSKIPGGKGDFDDKAIERTVIVISGIAVIILVYLAVKFVILKKRKVIKRYGRVEASEMDLLDEMEEDESEEEEELFDINRQRRS